jgi:hypothetical protein
LLRVDLRERDAFLDNYVACLLANPASLLYREISDIQSQGGYRIPESDKLLHFLFADARWARRLAMWRPIGESVIAELDRLRRDHEEDQYNRAADRQFEDRLRFASLLFASVFLFDLMVRNAQLQQVGDSMWLHYFTFFVQGIVRNYLPSDPAYEMRGELRTRYGELLSVMFRTMSGWARPTDDTPTASHKLRYESAEAEPDNIPKSSILALAGCLRHVLSSDRIGARLKNELSAGVFHLYFDLRMSKRHEYAYVLVMALKSGSLGLTSKNGTYSEQLDECWEAFDKVPFKLGHPEFVAEFETQLFGRL